MSKCKQFCELCAFACYMYDDTWMEMTANNIIKGGPLTLALMYVHVASTCNIDVKAI